MTEPTTVVPTPLPAVAGAGLTHAGVVRRRNEDSILTDPSGVLWAIADGMGGYGNGDIASDIVIERLASIPDGGEPLASLSAGLRAANDEILRRAARLGEMGATAVAMMVVRMTAHIAWAGDSRAYLLRRRSLRLLTTDHSVVQDLVARGAIEPEEAGDHPYAHVVTRAVGAERELEVDTVSVPLVPGDHLMLCSDGLTDCVADAQIAARLGAAREPEAACRTLVADALRAGAPDNVSVIAVFIGEG